MFKHLVGKRVILFTTDNTSRNYVATLKDYLGVVLSLTDISPQGQTMPMPDKIINLSSGYYSSIELVSSSFDDPASKDS